jgi:tetratricopeptide (TPR) repeat protein
MQNLLLKVSLLLMVLAVAAHAVSLGDSQQGNVAIQSMTVAQLEKAGDESRADKDYEHAIQYFKEALRHDRKNARLYNKLGMTELKSGDFKGARNDFTQAAKYNHQLPEVWNNLGVTYYIDKNYASAAKYFKKAVALDETRPTYHVNLGVAWFAQNDLERAMREYARALELDPDALVRSSRAGVDAQITNPEERAKHNYMMAKVYAKLGNTDSCLVCLRKAKEDGYRDLEKVYKDKEFSSLWQDPRLAAIVPPPVPK